MYEAQEAFYSHLSIKRAFGDVTIEGYRRTLTKFLKESQPKCECVEKYILDMKERKYSYSHIRNTIVILENYMAFIRRPIKLGRMRRPKPIVKDILTEGEVARILAACKNSREKTMLALLTYSGMRNKELCSLKTGSISLDEGVIRIFDGKGSKDRLVYITRECAKILMEYLQCFPRSKEGFLITTLVKGNHYKGQDLRKMVKVVSKRAKVNKRVYPHLFRHSLASHLVSRNCSLVTLQNLLGHSQLNTTAIYIRSFPQKIQAEYQYLVPNYI